MNTVQETPAPRTCLRQGLFVVFEGIDGGGKTTQALRLKDRLESGGICARYIKEPTDGEWGRRIRAIARDGREGISPEEELDYFIRDREEDVRDNIGPALKRGEVVIADRYYHSTIAYQSSLGLPEDLIRRRNAHFPRPDIVFLIDIPPELSQVRITEHRNEKANTGYEQIEFLRKVKAVFDRLEDSSIVRLDGSRDKNEVSAEVWARVGQLIGRNRD